jgi:hypothetical protein
MTPPKVPDIAALDVRDGIEYFTVRGREECQCARCGSSVEWVTFPGTRMPAECHCLSDRVWCVTHPLPGREQIESTALSSEAWGDAEF